MGNVCLTPKTANPVIRVDPDRAIAEVPENFAGVNVNYLVDHDDNRPGARPLASALVEMGARILRFPGGEKSDFHLWSQSPWEAPHPTINDRKTAYREIAERHRLMDFDEFMELTRATEAIPYVVTAYDSIARTGMTEEQFIENAVAWVRYANLRKRYKVRYWEIGNENWHNDTGSPDELAGIVERFSRAMKSVDPGILIGASGCNMDWWERFLPQAAPHIDFLSVSNYGCGDWKSFEHYRRTGNVALANQAAYASEAISQFAAESDRDRLFVVAAELNSMDFSKDGWPNRNNLGHALATMEIYGQLLLVPRVRHALLWNTRWVDWRQPDTIWYALGPENDILPAGRAVAVWGRFLRDVLVASERTDTIVSFASTTRNRKELNVFLTNKSEDDQVIDLAIQGRPSYREATIFRFSGVDAEDMAPEWHELGVIPVQGNGVGDLRLRNTSFTLVSLK